MRGVLEVGMRIAEDIGDIGSSASSSVDYEKVRAEEFPAIVRFFWLSVAMFI